MPSIADALKSKPPLGAELAAAIRDLSANQEIPFSLYQRYVNPIDGMNYWLRVQPSVSTVATAGLRMLPGLASRIPASGESIQVSPGGRGAVKIIGGRIINPLTVVDQDIDFPRAGPLIPGLLADESNSPEDLFVDFTGPASCRETATTTQLKPGEWAEIPSTTAAWVNAATGGHRFTVMLYETMSQVKLPSNVVVMGSFHYDSLIEQRADATVDSGTVVFTSLSEIQPFNEIGPDFLYIGSYQNVTFAFGSRGYLYEQADLYHYVGSTINSVYMMQIIDDPATFQPEVFNSDSIPIWLYLNSYVAPYPGGLTCPFKLYPAFLVDGNLPPPFGSVEVVRTDALASFPSLGPRMEADQLCRDRVTIHMYGVNNRMASDFRDFVERYSADWGIIGISTVGAITDLKHIQPALKVIAQRKSITFDINYLQSVSRDMARQYILGTMVKVIDPVDSTRDFGIGVHPDAPNNLFAVISS